MASYIVGFSKVAEAHGFKPHSLANYVYAREMNKAANWFTDAYTRWRTGREIKASDAARKAMGLKPFDSSAPVPKPGVYDIQKSQPLVQLAQNYSNSYRPGLSKPKVYHDGKAVAK
jgi:hypothetical protein